MSSHIAFYNFIQICLQSTFYEPNTSKYCNSNSLAPNNSCILTISVLHMFCDLDFPTRISVKRYHTISGKLVQRARSDQYTGLHHHTKASRLSSQIADIIDRSSCICWIADLAVDLVSYRSMAHLRRHPGRTIAERSQIFCLCFCLERRNTPSLRSCRQCCMYRCE